MYLLMGSMMILCSWMNAKGKAPEEVPFLKWADPTGTICKQIQRPDRPTYGGTGNNATRNEIDEKTIIEELTHFPFLFDSETGDIYAIKRPLFPPGSPRKGRIHLLAEEPEHEAPVWSDSIIKKVLLRKRRTPSGARADSRVGEVPRNESGRDILDTTTPRPLLETEDLASKESGRDILDTTTPRPSLEDTRDFTLNVVKSTTMAPAFEDSGYQFPPPSELSLAYQQPGYQYGPSEVHVHHHYPQISLPPFFHYGLPLEFKVTPFPIPSAGGGLYANLLTSRQATVNNQDDADPQSIYNPKLPFLFKIPPDYMPSIGDVLYAEPRYPETVKGAVAPTYAQDAYVKPTYSVPTYGQDAYDTPTYSAPTYGQDTYGPDAYGPPPMYATGATKSCSISCVNGECVNKCLSCNNGVCV